MSELISAIDKREFHARIEEQRRGNELQSNLIGGSSVRLAIKKSLSTIENSVTSDKDSPSTPEACVVVNQKTKSPYKPEIIQYTANPTIVDMWGNKAEISSENIPQTLLTCRRRSRFIEQIPIEMLSSFIPSFLRVVELCAFRSTCRLAWDCVATHAFDSHISALCQGQFNAHCEPVGMMTSREYELCGFSRPIWRHAHNTVCQVCLV